ncbi:MAG TPA: chemotaxis protein CheB [Terriglobia bacterium]|nr:chemotaxis protein CheB [Terriglobia bacterium]
MITRRQPRKRKLKPAPKRGVDVPATDKVPLIVGVGASAGGLQAFTELLKHLPGDPGMALVLVQHLAPRHASALTELLGHTAKMPVTEVTGRTRIESNHVYVIPPDSDMEVRRGELHLVPRAGTQPHRPIDHFLDSLVEDRGPKAVGVILSGTASDGTLGLKTIKAGGGTTFAQDPEQAEHAEMPRNAIAAGYVDFVLPIESIARELLRIARHPYLRQEPREEAGDEALPAGENERRKIYRTLRGATGVDFTHYKSSTIWRRIRRRMMLLKLDSLEAYTSYLQKHRDEVDALFQDMLIHVTGFFRDPEVFEALKREVFPNLVKDRPAGTPVRAWISGCSTGEEAYSVAIVLLEFLSEVSANQEVQIFATDVNEAALEKARQGEYLESIATDVSPERLRRFFMKTPHGYRINKSVRDLCIFARHDIGKDPPFSRLDLITCRNLLIYLGPVLQKRILPIFHYALKSTGFLLLGSSETIGTFAEYFSLVDKKHKLYRARPGARSHIMDLAGRAAADPGTPRREIEPELNDNFNLQKEANRILLNRFSPPGVIIDDDFKVVHFQGRTGRYLEPAPGNASLNLARMAREGLHVDLRAAVQEATRSHHPVRKRGVLMKQNAHTVAVDIEVIPIKGPAASDGYCLVLFQDATVAVPAAEPGKAAKGHKGRNIPSKTASREISHLKEELGQTRNTLQSTIEELEATNEELRSANEEGLSSNEELQSTNEELETAKEELQSANEELTTLNEELQNRNHALNIANNDLSNLLASVDIPILMLGNGLRIRRFTPSVQKLMNIVNADIGRPVSDVKLKFELSAFEKLIAEAVDNTAVKTLDVETFDGNWYSMRIRPYKTTENKIDGAVISWLEMTGMKHALDTSLERYKFIFERNLAGVFYAQDGHLLDCNEAFARMLGNASREETLQARNLNANITQKEQAEFHDRLVKEKNLNNELVAIKRKDGSDAWIVASATLTEDGGTAGLAVDITKQVQMEKQLGKLTRYLMNESDDRRRELARELHDQLGSSLGALLASVAAVGRKPQLDKETRGSLSQFQKQLQNCIKEVQTVSYLQHPLVLEQMGLAAAVRWYAEDFSRRAKIRTEVSISDSLGRMNEKIEIALYRIIQECLTNVRRHSGSGSARITIEARNGRVTAEIRDFGKGFAGSKESMGIIGMRERMKEVGGNLEVETGKDGTTVRATLDLEGAGN